MSEPFTRYRQPPREVIDILDAPPTPWVLLSPDARWMLLVEHAAMPSLADVARPMLKLAGLRIDPDTNARHQTSFGTGFVLRDRDGTRERRIELPDGLRISAVSWSHTSQRAALTLVGRGRTELWCLGVDDARLWEIARGLNAVFGQGFEWMPDGERLLLSLVVHDRGAVPTPPALPEGPIVQETYGDTSPLRTYQDLLASPHDEALFEHYATSVLALADARETRDAEQSSARPIGTPAIHLAFDAAPGGELVLVTRAHRPFSYLHGVYGFPQTIEVLDLDGRCVHVVAEVPMAENIPIEGVRLGPRSVGWSAHEDATLVWAEALDGGDPRVKVPYRDRWLELPLPFNSEPRELVRLEHRASALAWMSDADRFAAREYDRDRRWTRLAMSSRIDATAAPTVLDDRSLKDRYGDPGGILLRTTSRGQRIVRQEGPWIFRAGEGETPEGSRPFFDRQNLETLAVERLWLCPEREYESYHALVEEEDVVRALITRHESPRDPPNLRLRRFGKESFIALTSFPDPTPQLRDIQKELVTYTRDDGVSLSGTLYLPADHRPGTRLPLVLWAYPNDYVDADTAGQVRDTPHTFTRIGGVSHLFFLTQGYAVLDDASMPIIGDPASMNDTFIEQAVASARAAIEKLAAMGVCDPTRVGVGGHSYGAFMTATLLAHSDLFKAGIARSGAYNRTLTPFGFQAERRSLWEAKESYFKLSPFMFAEKIKTPLLMIHGAEDNNPGTFPLQSERLFHAIKGNGGTARYVSLPHEGHAYRARESILHVLAEMFEWFERYVKG